MTFTISSVNYRINRVNIALVIVSSDYNHVSCMINTVSLNVHSVKNIIIHVDFFNVHVKLTMRRVTRIDSHVGKTDEILADFNQIESLSSISFTLMLSMFTA